MPTIHTHSHLAHRPETAILIQEHGAAAVLAAVGDDDPRTISPIVLRNRITGGETVEEIADAIDAARCAHEDTNIALCPRGCHLRVARRWRRTCGGCGQPISAGDVGLCTWDDAHMCARGGWSHQHGCGEWNSPVEVTVNPAEHESMGQAIADAISRLDIEIQVLEGDEHQAQEASLRAELRAWLHNLPEQQRKRPHADAEEILAFAREEGIIRRGSEEQPGVWVNHAGEWEAWDYAPGGDETIEITESDLADRSDV